MGNHLSVTLVETFDKKWCLQSCIVTLTLARNFKCGAYDLHVSLNIVQSVTSALDYETTFCAVKTVTLKRQVCVILW